jgi:hypothetical protein
LDKNAGHQGKTGNPTTERKRKSTHKKTDTKTLPDYDDPDYPSTDESDDNRQGGIRMHGLLLEISKPYRTVDKDGNPKKRVRCLASKGCRTTWKWPRARQRIFKHAKDCAYLPVELHRRVCEEMANNAVGPIARFAGDNQDGDIDISDSESIAGRSKRTKITHDKEGKLAPKAFKSFFRRQESKTRQR